MRADLPRLDWCDDVVGGSGLGEGRGIVVPGLASTPCSTPSLDPEIRSARFALSSESWPMRVPAPVSDWYERTLFAPRAGRRWPARKRTTAGGRAVAIRFRTPSTRSGDRTRNSATGNDPEDDHRRRSHRRLNRLALEYVAAASLYGATIWFGHDRNVPRPIREGRVPRPVRWRRLSELAPWDA